MRNAARSLAIGIAVLLSAVPVFWIAVLTWNAFDGLVSMPSLYAGWALSYALWWFGFGAALVFARKCFSKSSQPWRQPYVLVPLVAGLITIGWMEVQSWNDAKHIFPAGFFVIPYALSIAAGWIARMLSNPTVETDAQKAARGSL